MTRTAIGCFVGVLLAATVSASGPDAKYKTPRTRDGQPDLQGVWSFASAVPLQRPVTLADKKVFTKEEFEKRRAAFTALLSTVAKFAPVENVALDWIDDKLYVEDLRTSLITYPENGRLPALVEGVGRNPGIDEILTALQDAGSAPPLALLASFGGETKNSHTDFDASERCLQGVDVPFVPQFGSSAVGRSEYLQIIQSADSMAIVLDYGRRVIAIDSRSQTASRVRTSSGTSRAHWEGDTLVVDTRNFSERTPGFAGAGRSRDKVVTERITRTSAGTIEYAATVVDPSTFKDRVDLSFPMARVDARIFEATCHEGNYSLANTLSASRKEDQK